MRSKLGRVKGLGSAHHGLSHWWLIRVTAVALIPLSLWFVISLVTALLSPNVIYVAQWFSSPVNAMLMVAMLAALFIHTSLGLQEVIVDYVKCSVSRYGLLMLNTFLCFAFAITSILAVLKLHFLDVVTSL
ncbi:MAG: succinate dehydrogenase, hydrophobic membrane anchor protein [Proteobacteria bacterium]|nr:succinate dehydrogenase, hydrophobic membrane anchor protein [Pseudomonadota bacterium]